MTVRLFTRTIPMLTDSKPERPAWLKQAMREARKHEARCTACKTQYLKGELNDAGHCRHCADELGEVQS